jgi:hypothetical protein
MPRPYDLRNVSASEIARLQHLRDKRLAAGWEGEPVKGDLRNWRHHHDEATGLGVIWGDTTETPTFNGWLRTSVVAAIEGDLAITLNSIYRLVGAEDTE